MRRVPLSTFRTAAQALASNSESDVVLHRSALTRCLQPDPSEHTSTSGRGNGSVDVFARQACSCFSTRAGYPKILSPPKATGHAAEAASSYLAEMQKNNGRSDKRPAVAAGPRRLSPTAEAITRRFYEFKSTKADSPQKAADNTLAAINTVRLAFKPDVTRPVTAAGAGQQDEAAGQRDDRRLELSTLEDYFECVNRYYSGPVSHPRSGFNRPLSAAPQQYMPPMPPPSLPTQEASLQYAREGLAAAQEGLQAIEAHGVLPNEWQLYKFMRLARAARNPDVLFSSWRRQLELGYIVPSADNFPFEAAKIAESLTTHSHAREAWSVMQQALSSRSPDPAEVASHARQMKSYATSFLHKLLDELGYCARHRRSSLPVVLETLHSAMEGVRQAQIPVERDVVVGWMRIAIKVSPEAAMPAIPALEALEPTGQSSHIASLSRSRNTLWDLRDPVNLWREEHATLRALMDHALGAGDLAMVKRIYKLIDQRAEHKPDTSTAGDWHGRALPSWPSARAELALLNAMARHKMWEDVFEQLHNLERKFPNDKAAVSPFDGLRALARLLKSEEDWQAAYQQLVDRKAKEVQAGEQLVTSAMLNVLLRAKALSGDYDATGLFFDEFKLAGVLHDVASYNAVLESCVIAKKVSAMEPLIEYMQQQGFKPDAFTYDLLTQGYLSLRDFDALLLALNRSTAEGVTLLPSTLNEVNSVASASSSSSADLVKQCVARMRPNWRQSSGGGNSGGGRGLSERARGSGGSGDGGFDERSRSSRDRGMRASEAEGQDESSTMAVA